MKIRILAVILGTTVLLSSSKLVAQPARVSPHETINTLVQGDYMNGSRVIVVYGRPYSKAPRGSEIRKIWGSLVPYGKVWRTGADEATLLVTPVTLEMGGATIPPGVYSLYTLPQEDGSAKLIINKQFGQWGLSYDEKQDLARVDLKKAALDKNVDQFTMVMQKTGSTFVLKMSWENLEYSVPFSVKS